MDSPTEEEAEKEKEMNFVFWYLVIGLVVACIAEVIVMAEWESVVISAVLWPIVILGFARKVMF